MAFSTSDDRLLKQPGRSARNLAVNFAKRTSTRSPGVSTFLSMWISPARLESEKQPEGRKRVAHGVSRGNTEHIPYSPGGAEELCASQTGQTAGPFRADPESRRVMAHAPEPRASVSLSAAPSGADSLVAAFPRLAPWATFCCPPGWPVRNRRAYVQTTFVRLKNAPRPDAIPELSERGNRSPSTRKCRKSRRTSTRSQPEQVNDRNPR